MAKLLIVVAIAVVLVVSILALRAKATKNADLPVMMELRDQILNSKPEDLGLTPVGDAPYVAVMEVVFPGAVVSVVTAATGDASLYYSSGGGVIGGIGHEAVRKAAIAFVTATGDHQASFSPTSNLSHPTEGQVRFFVRTAAGIRSATGDETDLRAGRGPLAPLYARGQDVITQLRLMSEGAKPPAA
jgi:hypothetical protein